MNIVERLDIVNWESIEEVHIFTSLWCKQFILEFILLTEKDRERFEMFYCNLPNVKFQIIQIEDDHSYFGPIVDIHRTSANDMPHGNLISIYY